jgi:hypothetical protein
VSMSGQWAPFDASYQCVSLALILPPLTSPALLTSSCSCLPRRWNATDGSYVIYNTSLTELNGYKGGITQESSSGIVTTVRPSDLDCLPSARFADTSWLSYRTRRPTNTPSAAGRASSPSTALSISLERQSPSFFALLLLVSR